MKRNLLELKFKFKIFLLHQWIQSKSLLIHDVIALTQDSFEVVLGFLFRESVNKRGVNFCQKMAKIDQKSVFLIWDLKCHYIFVKLISYFKPISIFFM